MNTTNTLLAFLALFAACNSVPEKNNGTGEGQNIEGEQRGEPLERLTASDKASLSGFELEILTQGKLNAPDMSIDSTNEYGSGDCFGKVTYYSQSGLGLATDSMSCGEHGYTYTHFVFTPRNVIQAVYLKQTESLLQPDGKWKYALSERIIDFKGSQAILMERADTLDDHTMNTINKEFSVKSLKDSESTIRKWTK